MTQLFGLQLDQIINDALTSAGGLRPGTLTHVTPGERDTTNLLAGTNNTETTHSFQGYVEQSEGRKGDSLVRDSMAMVGIMGASVTPFVVPEVGDRVVIDGTQYTLLKLKERDPARALYVFQTEA